MNTTVKGLACAIVLILTISSATAPSAGQEASSQGAIVDAHKTPHSAPDERIQPRADLAGASLVGANLIDCNLSQAVLVGADVSEARAAGANFQKADLRRTLMHSQTSPMPIYPAATSQDRFWMHRSSLIQTSPGQI